MTQSTFRPLHWLACTPVALLPLLAAVMIQGVPHEFRGLGDVLTLVARHWFWLAVCAGQGVWAGWHIAGEKG